MIVAPNGDLLVCCETRKTDLNDDGDIDLVQTGSSDGGNTWSPHSLINEERDRLGATNETHNNVSSQAAQGITGIASRLIGSALISALRTRRTENDKARTRRRP